MMQWLSILLGVSLIINAGQFGKVNELEKKNQTLEVRLGIKDHWINATEVAMVQAQIDLMNCKNSLQGRRYVPLKRVTH